jgi:hypothetical protein
MSAFGQIDLQGGYLLGKQTLRCVRLVGLKRVIL